MTKREKLHAAIISKREQIQRIEQEIKALVKETVLLSDDKQWYEEKDEEHEISKRPKKTQVFRIGRIRWNEDMKDEDTGEVIVIERSRIVFQDGEWFI